MKLINLAQPLSEVSSHVLHLVDDKTAGSTKRPPSDKPHVDSEMYTQNDQMETKELLLRTNPGKLLYSMKETALALGVSYEFIRQKIQSGDVITKQFSTRKMVHLNELTKLINQGIPT